jgi:hypothetical protein
MYHFGVSYEAALRQLETLRRLQPMDRQRLDSELRGNLRSAARRLGYPTELTSPTRDTVLPRDYIRRAFDAYAEGIISDARLGELLFTDEEDARSQAVEAGIVLPGDTLDERDLLVDA